MDITEQHPYYVNYLCNELWSQNSKPPTLEKVNEAWAMVLEEDRSDLLKDFFLLAENQRRVMMRIANFDGKNLYSNDSAKKMNIPISSISRALSTLIEKDFIEKVGDDYRIIVPVYKKLLFIA